jgi:transcriptional regulator with XRE-family HTH domain
MSEKFTVDHAALGEKLRKKRLSLELSQEAVAEKSNLSVGFYGNVERGNNILSIDSLVRVANALDLDLNYLLFDFMPKDADKKLQAEIDIIFKGKTPAQSAYLLHVLKLFSENMDGLIVPELKS